MFEVNFIKILISLGVPGVALGIFYLLYNKFSFGRNTIPKKYYGPLSVIFLLLVAVVVIFALHLWSPKNDNGKVIHNKGVIIEENSGVFIDKYFEEVYKPDFEEMTYYEQGDAKRIIGLLRDEELLEAEELLNSFSPTTEEGREFLNRYKTSFFFANGDYLSALKSVLERYEGLPIADVRHRYDFAYIIYFMRVMHGQEYAEEVIDLLRRKFPRPDLSYVWMGVHPTAIKRLMEQDLYPYQDLHIKQQKILMSVIEKYPDDYFIDHAYYHLHYYDKIIKGCPNSFIREEAYYAKAYRNYYLKVKKPVSRLYYKVRIGKISKQEMEDGLQVLQPVIQVVIGDYYDFIGNFKSSNLLVQAFESLAYAASYKKDYNEALVEINKAYGMLKKIEGGLEKEKYTYALLGLCRAVKDLFQKRILFDNVEEEYYRLPQEIRDNININELYVYKARWRFDEKNYPGALSVYKKISGDTVGVYYKREPLRIKKLEELLLLSKKYSDGIYTRKEYLFKAGIALKETIHDADHAVSYFDQYKDLVHQAEHPKVELLKAFCYRNASMGKLMLETLDGLYRNYPNHHLADDALAEIGLYYLLWISDYDAAIRRFDLVIRRYPYGNAVDNALNWKAYALMKRKDYSYAFNAYMEIVRREPLSRFVKYAFNNIVKILRVTDTQDYSPIQAYLYSIGEYDDAGYAEIDNKPFVFYADQSGRLNILGVDFSEETRISDFKFLREMHCVAFKANDYQYKVNYVWNVLTGKLMFVAKDKKTGAVNMSDEKLHLINEELVEYLTNI